MEFNTAIIGTGIGMKHFIAINSYKNSRVTVIYEKNSNKLQKLKKKFPKIIFAKNENEIFENKNINVVSIASYDDDHYRQIIKGIKNNKHLIIEKPICLTFEQLKSIKKLLDKSKVQITSNLVLRVNSLFKNIHKILKNDKIFYLELDYIWGRRDKFSGWRSQIKDYSFTLGAAVHVFDLLLWFVGKKPISVIAIGNDIITKNTSFKKKSFIVYILKFHNGLIAKISANGCAIYNHLHEVKIFQKNKTIINDINGAKIIFKKNKKIFTKKMNFSYPDKQNRKNLIIDFLDSLSKKKYNHIVSKNDIFDAMSICFAADKSLKKNKEIIIKYL
tara:strand:+ start:1299 stop:2291 length:993 start_codon:yes stop_codon:yes gene_type:complete